MNHANPEYGPGYSQSRVKIVLTDKMSNLTILKTVQEDEGMYHCCFIDWKQNIWQGTYLLIKGNTVGTLNYTVVQSLMVSDSAHPVDYVTLHCSVLTDFENKECSEDPSLFWLRSNKSHPEIIYTNGIRTNRCQKKFGEQTRCVYNFSKTVNSYDAGTYYCAVATCGEILVGHGTKLDFKGSTLWTQDAGKVIILLFVVLATCLVVIPVLMWSIQKNKCLHCKAGTKQQKRIDGPKPQQRFEDGWIYSVAVFTSLDSDWTELKKKVGRKKIYAAVKAFELK